MKNSLDHIIRDCNQSKLFFNANLEEDLGSSLRNLILSLAHNKDIRFYGEQRALKNEIHILDPEHLASLIAHSESQIYFQTSGTTGTPKTVKKNIHELTKGVIMHPGMQNLVWGFCYSTRHISGVFVMLQALMTNSRIVDLRNLSGKQMEEKLHDHQVTNISAPATFFKMYFPLKAQVHSVRKVTNGGEPMDEFVMKNVMESFPNAEIRNVYASTEFGSLLISDSARFSIPVRLKQKVKIRDEKIFVHKSLLSDFDGADVEWYDTKDKIRMVNDMEFEIIGRVSEDVKVLGHLVSLRKVENIIAQHPSVSIARISASPHQVFGHLLSCEVVLSDPSAFDKKVLKAYMKQNLRDYEVPMKVNIVDSVITTSSGKIKR